MRDLIIMLLVCSVTMSALGVSYMAFTPFLAKRYSARDRYYAWLVIVIGLIIPIRPRFDSPFVKVTAMDTPRLILQVGSGPQFVTPTVGALQPAAVPHSLFTWWQAAAVVWGVGMAAFLGYHLVKHCRFLKMTERWSDRITEEESLRLFQSVRSELGISKEIGLYRCASIGTPMLTGFVHPKILLPDIAFAKDDLRFILDHELIHYKRRDLWYKGLVLSATAIHWFNPLMYLIAGAIDAQCEMSCDSEVVKHTGADTRQQYSEAIIGVVKYQSRMKTALSTSFYGGKKGMKKRIFSIMDTRNKKAGAAVLCVILVLTLGTGAAFAANAGTQDRPEDYRDHAIEVKPGIAVMFSELNPEIYAPYAAFDLSISEDGSQLLYQGQPVRMFVDEEAPSQAFYLNESGTLNLLAVRNDAGEVTAIESITAKKAQEYKEAFFESEYQDRTQEKETVTVMDNETVGPDKYEQYQPFGVICSAEDGGMYYNGQRVKLLVDEYEAGWFGTFWTDDAGSVNLEVIRDASGQISRIESISDEKAQEYLSASDHRNEGLEEKVEQRVEQRMRALPL